MPLLNIEMGRARIILPHYASSSTTTTTTTNNNNYDIVVFQILQLTLSSQMDNPIVRNFTLNSPASLDIYDRAKLNGSLYKPGFVFEDRQYSLHLKDMALFASKSACLEPPTALPHASPLLITAAVAAANPFHQRAIVSNWNLRVDVGLPILLGKHLINGYVMEANTPTSDLTLYVSNADIDLALAILDENMRYVNTYGELWRLNVTTAAEELQMSTPLPPPPPPPPQPAQAPLPITRTVSSTGGRELRNRGGDVELEIVPLDFLLTSHNLVRFVTAIE